MFHTLRSDRPDSLRLKHAKYRRISETETEFNIVYSLTDAGSSAANISWFIEALHRTTLRGVKTTLILNYDETHVAVDKYDDICFYVSGTFLHDPIDMSTTLPI